MRATATALAKAKIVRFDMSDLQPSAFGATSGQGDSKLFQDFLKNPSDVNGIAAKLEAAAAKAYKGGKRRERRAATAEPPAAGAPPGRGRNAGAATPWRCLPRARRGPARRLDRLPDDLHDQAELLRPGGDTFVWFDNYKEIFTTDMLVTAVKNNAIWVGVVPALVTAIGLIFAVLTERIAWSVAFKQWSSCQWRFRCSPPA